MRNRKIELKGLFVSIYLTKPDGSKGSLHKRALVSPEFIELWFHIIDNDFNDLLWTQLSQRDRDFIAYCAHQSGIVNRRLETALAHSSRDLVERMKTLEVGLLSGNWSKDILKEFNTIIDRLVLSGQLAKSFGTKQKNKLERTYESMTK